MASRLAKAFRQFVGNVSRIVRRINDPLETIARGWRSAVESMRKASKRIGSLFDFNIAKVGNKIRIGKADGLSFTNLLRRGRAVEAIESASATTITGAARRGLMEMNETIIRSFPDAAVVMRDSNVAARRARSGIKRAVRSASELSDIVNADSRLLRETSRVSTIIRRTKQIAILGGTITVAGFGINALIQAADDYAKKNSGCFMYVSTGKGVRKCRINGCTCPLNKLDDAPACNENELPDNMKTKNSECSKLAEQPGCVHCDMDVTDVNSLQYVNRENFPDNAYVKCEHMDALDALNEMIGSVLGDAWSSIADVNQGLSDSVASSVKFLPYIFGVVVIVILGIIIGFLFRMYRRLRKSTDGLLDNNDDGTEGKNEFLHSRT